LDLYKSKGFEKLTTQLKHLEPLKKPEVSSQELTIQDLNSILNRLDIQGNQATESQEVTLVVDRSKKDIGLLIRLY
jgi:hypothetical protein